MLQEMRKKRGYSQSELAAALGVNVRTIQGYEIAKANINQANLTTLCNLAIALNCKITDLLTDKELIAKYKLANKIKTED